MTVLFWRPYRLLCLLALISLSLPAAALDPLWVDGREDGVRQTGHFEIWFDPDGKASLPDARAASAQGKFAPLASRGSTGLQPGAVWSHFQLRNVSDEAITLHLEYVDHQLISLNAWQQNESAGDVFSLIAALKLGEAFSLRPIPHNRYVIPVVIPANERADFYIRFGSDQYGFIFPDLRVWEPKALRKTQLLEISIVAFFFGGFFLMSIFTLVGGLASGERAFTIYSVYAFSKILVWATVLGYTHQFFLQQHFHWSYMSLTGAISIFSGLWFSRTFLQTRETIPKLDYVLRFMMANAVFLFACALFKLTTLTVVSITFALILYPVLSVAGLIRWYQGSREGATFALAWTFLVTGLFLQALRDLGYVNHNLINYYWPPLASFTEMVVILVAMGIKFRRLRIEKEVAEHRYTQQLEQSKDELEALVQRRTHDLQSAKQQAEWEARTDALTQVINRRYFYLQGEAYLEANAGLGKNFSLLMFDIDHFKQINDTFGHATGDDALRIFASTITSHVRGSDIFGRLGGEEFGLIMEGRPEDVMHKAAILKDAISHICVSTDKVELTFTTSIGVAHYRQGEDLDTLLKRADQALYVAKDSGRNRILVA